MSSFSNITDDFTNHNGMPDASYLQLDTVTPVIQPKHYNIRSFHSDNLTVPWTMNDMQYWNVSHFSTFIMDDFTHRRSIGGRTFRRHTMSEIDTFTMTTIDTLTMDALDFAISSSGDEEWPPSDVNVVFGRDSALNYTNSLAVTLTGGAGTKTVTSAYNDDISTDFQDQNYYIEMQLSSFPAQAAGVHLDLTNSFIDFSSDGGTYAGATTDSIPFSASLNSLSAGGDLIFRINRSSLTHANLSALTNIRLRLVALGAGTMTFKTTSIRLIPNSWTQPSDTVDTKRQIFHRDYLAALTNPRLLFTQRPMNTTLVAKFNNGHNPVGNDNLLRFYFRYVDDNNHLRVELYSRSTQSRLRIWEKVAGVDTEIFSTGINTNILSTTTDYWLIVNLSGVTITASVWNGDGLFQTTQVYTTGAQTVTHQLRGYIGYSLEPFNYDFYVSNIAAQTANYALYESTPFNSQTPVTGVTLLPVTSLPIDLIDGTALQPLYDASMSYDSTTGEYTLARTGTQWIGGLTTVKETNVSDANQLFVNGEIYVTSIRGLYRLALVDVNGSVGWIHDLEGGINAQQWSSFSVPLLMQNVLPQGFFIQIHQAGFYNDTFKVRNLSMNYASVEWFSSPDGGTTWQSFLDSQGGQYTGLRFDTAGTAVKVRGVARSDAAWIQGYELIPHYKYPGHK